MSDRNDWAGRTSRLSPAKQALLARRLERAVARESGALAAAQIPRREDRATAPLSFAQQRLWFLHLFEPDNPVHNMPWAVRIRGPLPRAALRRALESIVARHETLRTTFQDAEPQPLQVVHPPRPVELPLTDLGDGGVNEQAALLEQALLEEVHRPFNLARDLPVRGRLFRLAAEEHVLLVVLHHISCDGWSYGLLERELEALCQAFAAGAAPTLPELPIQYGDFAQWQRQWLQGEILQAQIAYWKRQLAGVPALLELPTDFPRPALRTYAAGSQVRRLSGELVAALSNLCRREQVTRFMGLLAAFEILLARYAGQDDILVGTPSAGRSHLETEGLIGFFVNTLVLRNSLAGNPTVGELLARVRGVTLEALARQDVPFEHLVQELELPRSTSHAPLFQVMFALQNAPRFALQLPGVEVSRCDASNGSVEFDLFLALRERESEIEATLTYNRALWTPETIERLLAHYETLLAAMVADPERRIAELPLLTPPERERLLVAWNRTQADYPREACLHQLVEAQAQRTPDAVAVRFAERQLTYRELNRRANQLAHYLAAHGVGPDIAVGLCIDRSPELVVALLAILKAGGAYVPLDPEYPAERLKFILDDARPAVVVTQSSLGERLPEFAGHFVRLDTDWPRIAQEPDTDPARSTGPDSLAYILHTSGSTGAPKGVMITHRALINALTSFAREPGIAASDVLLAITTISFDIAGLELFLPLLAGATIVLVGRDQARDPMLLSALLADERISMLQATPATWRMLLNSGWHPRANLKMLCGGEALDADLAAQLLSGGGELWNLYGPTEATIWSTACRIISAQPPIAIGRPIANTRLYVLDRNRRMVPATVPGELYIAGDGLARGYLNRTELTEQRFVTLDLPERPGERAYRTGDLVRYRHDGTLEYLGRGDQQVKIRGFRVELGEIEAALLEHPAVHEAVVVVREDQPGDKRLVAYFVSTDGQVPAADELRALVAGSLPAYMIPAVFVPLASLPTTPNQKVDRRALPAPSRERADDDREYVPPRDEAERALAEIWGGVLGIEQVGVRDDFFNLGGHSLLAVQLFGRIERRFGRRLPLATLFQEGTIEAQARLLGEHQSAWPESPAQRRRSHSIIEIQPAGTRPPLFLVPSFTGDLLHYRELVQHLGNDQPLFGFEPQDADAQKWAAPSIEEMAALLAEELLRFQPAGPYLLAGYSYGGVVAYELAQQLVAQGHRVALLAIIDTGTRRFAPQSFREIVGSLPRLVGNFPRWVKDDLLEMTPGEILARASRKARTAATQLVLPTRANSKARRALDDFVDLKHLPENYQQLIEANYEAFMNYQPRPYLGRVTLLRARTRPLLRVASKDLGWGELASEGVEVVVVPGHHGTILLEPRVRVLAAHLRGLITRATAESASPR